MKLFDVVKFPDSWFKGLPSTMPSGEEVRALVAQAMPSQSPSRELQALLDRYSAHAAALVANEGPSWYSLLYTRSATYRQKVQPELDGGLATLKAIADFDLLHGLTAAPAAAGRPSQAGSSTNGARPQQSSAEIAARPSQDVAEIARLALAYQAERAAEGVFVHAAAAVAHVTQEAS